MMRILVAQMTRMGDMIQTTPLIRTLRFAHPDAHITVLVRKMSKGICEQNPDINEVLVYEEDEMYQNLCAQDSDRLLSAYEKAETVVALLRERRFDVCYNCTHSIASAMLFKLAEIPQVVGAHLSDDWQFVLRGRWVTYFFTSVFYRQYNALNLCDITRHFAANAPECHEVVLGVSDDDRAFALALLREHGVADGDFVVCFQLGASENKKRWTEERFAALAKLLVEQRRARIILLGVREEAPLGEAFERAAPGLAIHLFGKTTISQVGALLSRAQLLVTNDTGTMHIAAAVRCPMVLVSVGHVHFRETGPYGAGHCAIERRRDALGPADWTPSGPDEGSQLSPAQVFRAVECVLGGATEEWTRNNDTGDMAEVELYRSEFAPDGCLDWYPVLRRPLKQTDLIRVAYRAMWLEFLRAKSGGESERSSVAKMLASFEVSADTLKTCGGAPDTDFAALADLAQRGIVAAERLLTSLEKIENLQMAKEQVGGLTRLDEEIRLFGEVHEPCRPLVLISRYERDNLEGSDPVQLAQATLQIYRDLDARARLMTTKLAALFAMAEGIAKPSESR
ncbi:MAG: glycosyltransferase family 9 protein [Candidatus Hydrogenedentes bacterium]|nr:glycosyltransferase family 9 protein [Candidatus Hydrogenedentota bacterium]